MAGPMVSIEDKLQAALYTLLVGDAALIALLATRNDDVGGKAVLDFVPENQAYPYITIGDFEVREWRTLSRPGFEVLATVNTWSQFPGNNEVQIIQRELHRLLGDVDDITVDEFTFCASWFDFSRTLKTVDAAKIQTRQQVNRYRMKVQQEVGF